MRVVLVLVATLSLLAGCCCRRPCAPAPCCPPPTCCAPVACETCTPVQVPAVTVTEQVPVFRPAFCRKECVAPVYGTQTRLHKVSEATYRTVRVPAKYECVQEKVLVCPARQRVVCRWKYDACGNRREVHEVCGTPAKFAVRTRKLLVCPAHDEQICVPARYENSTCRVLLRPGATNCVLEPAQCDVCTRTRVVKPARTEWRRTVVVPSCPCPCPCPCPCSCGPCGGASPCAAPVVAPAPAPQIEVAPAEAAPAAAPADAPPAGAVEEPKGEAPPAEEAKPTSRRAPSGGDWGVPPAVAAQRR
jgi:hypothetical protein